MQDNEPQTPQHSDDLSVGSGSELVRVEPGDVLPQRAPLGFPYADAESLGSRLIKQGKEHTQLFIGLVLGAITTLFLGQANTSSSPPLYFQSLGLDEGLMSPPFASLFSTETGELATVDATSPPPPPGSQAPLAPQLKFVDRFYFASAPPEKASERAEPEWFMIDRFYFSGAPAAVLSPAPELPVSWPPVASPQNQAVIPPLDNWAYSPQNQQGILAVPPPPDLSPVAMNLPPQYQSYGRGETPQTNTQTNALSSGQHTLLGIVQTNRFGAALIKTGDSSYSVRVGDTLRQSGFRLTQLEPDRAILSNGQRTFGVNVGERF